MLQVSSWMDPAAERDVVLTIAKRVSDRPHTLQFDSLACKLSAQESVVKALKAIVLDCPTSSVPKAMYLCKHVIPLHQLLRLTQKACMQLEEVVASFVNSFLTPLFKANKLGKEDFKWVSRKSVNKVLEGSKGKPAEGFMSSEREAKIRKLVEGYIKARKRGAT